MLGISFRPLQATALGLDPRRSLAELLSYPFPVIRLAAYWDQLELRPGQLDWSALDWQIDAAAAAGKKIILCVGAVKSFGYPEFFVPAHRLPEPLPGRPADRSHAADPSAEAGCGGRGRRSPRRSRRTTAGSRRIIGWQVEHEPVDPLGMEHSWRLAAAFVEGEVAAVRAADPGRPVVLTGFVPTSTPVRLQQRWRTRDQGDSLAVAAQLAEPTRRRHQLPASSRHGLARLGPRSVYLTGSRSAWQRRAAMHLAAGLAGSGRPLMISECQAEPWETVTTPPSEPGLGMYSCLPEHVVGNYNAAMRLGTTTAGGPWAFLFWGAEYWLRRRDQGDGRYLDAFARVLAGR